MAEAFAKNILPKNFHIESAGTEAHSLNPFTVDTMKEVRIDISKNKIFLPSDSLRVPLLPADKLGERLRPPVKPDPGCIPDQWTF